MRIARGAWVGTVLVAMAAACSHAVDGGYSAEEAEGGAPHYEGGAADATGTATDGAAAGSEASAAAEAGASSNEGGSAQPDGGSTTAEASTGVAEGGSEAATSDEASVGAEAGIDASGAGHDDAGQDAGSEAGHDASGEVEAAAPEAGIDAGLDASASDAADAAAEAAVEAGPDAGSIVAPVCDGVIGAGEYGAAGNQAASSSGQTWYVTWDQTNLYVAIDGANIDEGNVVYLALAPLAATPPAGGATSGALYDSTDVTTLPFGAQLAVYAHDGYTEARVATGGAWGPALTTSVILCDTGTADVREEVIPWSLVGGKPESFGWTGYLAANGNANPSGYIYGQMPTSNPSGAPANADTFTAYYALLHTVPGVDSPFVPAP
jgi:hypothetical protein